MMSEFERVCNVCGHVHVGSRAELARLTVCEGCGAQLPQGMRVHAAAAPVASGEGAGEPRVLVCPHCGHRHEGTAERLSSLWYCEECAEPLEGASPEAVARPGGSEAPAPESPATLCLRLAGADVCEELPRTAGEGVFGRLTAASPTLASARTLSRRQFAYRYLDDGSLEIRNLSQFGTRVAGELLSGEGEAATARPPATVEMAGLVFSLERM